MYRALDGTSRFGKIRSSLLAPFVFRSGRRDLSEGAVNHHDVAQKLELLFERYCCNKLSLNSYISELQNEIALLDSVIESKKYDWFAFIFRHSQRKRQIERLSGMKQDVNWCLNWAKDRRDSELISYLN